MARIYAALLWMKTVDEAQGTSHCSQQKLNDISGRTPEYYMANKKWGMRWCNSLTWNRGGRKLVTETIWFARGLMTCITSPSSGRVTEQDITRWPLLSVTSIFIAFILVKHRLRTCFFYLLLPENLSFCYLGVNNILDQRTDYVEQAIVSKWRCP